MRALDGGTMVKNSTNAGAFNLPLGGRYAISVSATFGGGSVALQQLGPDGTTYLDIKDHFNNAGTAVELTIGSFASAGVFVLDLPAGTYKFTITTATAVYASIARIPGE